MMNPFHNDPTTPDYPNPYNSNPYAPPPPRRYKWPHLLTFVFVATSLLVIASMVGYIFGYTQSPVVETQKTINASVPTQTSTARVFITPNASPPPYQYELNSGNSDLFVHAFSQALLYQDTNNLAAHTDTTQFIVSCHASLPGNCSSGWSTISTLLTQDKLELSVDPYAHMTEKPPTADVNVPRCQVDYACQYYLVGSYMNASDLPLQHYGPVVFSFTTCCGGSGRSFTWESIDFNE